MTNIYYSLCSCSDHGPDVFVFFDKDANAQVLQAAVDAAQLLQNVKGFQRVVFDVTVLNVCAADTPNFKDMADSLDEMLDPDYTMAWGQLPDTHAHIAELEGRERGSKAQMSPFHLHANMRGWWLSFYHSDSGANYDTGLMPWGEVPPLWGE